MTEHESLSLQSVITKFNEADECLSGIAEKLYAIGLAESTTQAASESISTASESLAGVLLNIDAVLAVIKSIATDLSKAVSSAEAFLSGNELSAIRAELSEQRQSMEDRLDRLASEELESRHKTVRRGQAELARRIERIESALPARWIKRAEKKAGK